MILFGTIINVLLIIVGAVIGRFLHNIPDRMKETVMYGIGLAVAVIGIQMTFESYANTDCYYQYRCRCSHWRMDGS